MSAAFSLYADSALGSGPLGGTGAATRYSSLGRRAAAPTASVTSRPEWVTKALTRMVEVAYLDQDWDGRGSTKPSLDTLSYAMDVLIHVMPWNAPTPSIVPLGHGGIQMLWHTVSFELEVEIVDPGTIITLLVDRVSGNEDEWPEKRDLKQLSEALTRLFGS